MGYIIGTDEAGYGPNLGPLVISATVWEAPDGVSGEGLFESLDGVVGKMAQRGTGNRSTKKKEQADNHSRVNALPVFADSKILYSPGKGWGKLEQGLWAAWSLLGWKMADWREIWEKLSPGSLEAMEGCPFYNKFDLKLPREYSLLSNIIQPSAREGQGGSLEWRDNFLNTGVKLLAVRSRTVFPEEFNLLMDRHESKGAALSHLTLGLVAEMMQPLKNGPISVLCDKHGGRDRYAALLNEHFYDGFIEVGAEGRQSSVYRFGPAHRRVEFQFRAKAESCLPAALASMASKYLRELAMEAFNAFWAERVPNLAPTAGYPQDAVRFRAEIAKKQLELGIEDAVLWRKK